MLAHEVAHLPHHTIGLFERCAFRHVDGDVEGIGIVFGQHLELHQAEGRHQHDQYQRRRHADEKALARRGLVQQAREQPQVVAFQPAGHVFVRVRVVRQILSLEPAVRRPRRHGVGNGERHEHGDRHVERDRSHVRTHHARHPQHWQKRQNHGEGREVGRLADLVHRLHRRLQLIRALLGVVTVDVLDHHDRVVHQQTE